MAKAYSTSFNYDDNLRKRIQNVLCGTETISQFAYRATLERINRKEARSDRAKEQLHKKTKEELRPIIKELLQELGNNNS